VSKLKIPPAYKQRLDAVAPQHGFASGAVLAEHLVERGLRQYEAGPELGKLAARLAHVVEEHGYSSPEEVVEHLLERGLRAYEEPADDPEALAARLRGLGYID